jgi:hypothetical protein
VADKLDDRLTVTIDGEDKEIFMSFGLLSELANITQSAEGVAEMDLNPNVAMLVIDTCLAPRNARGKITDKDFTAPQMDADTAEKILKFAGEHTLGFFIKGLKRGIDRLESRRSELQAVGRSLNSTPSSPSETAS